MRVELRRKRRAVVLYSGGLDSMVALMWTIKEGYECFPLCFDYGQSNWAEMGAAEEQIEWFKENTSQRQELLSCYIQGYADLAPQCVMLNGGKGDFMDQEDTNIPNRAVVFVSLAGAYAVGLGATTVVLGLQTEDPSVLPCRGPRGEIRSSLLVDLEIMLQEYVTSHLYPMRVLAPLFNVGKKAIVGLAMKWGLPEKTTISCLQGKYTCGNCIVCNQRDSIVGDRRQS